MFYLHKLGFGGQSLVLGTSVDTYVKYNSFEKFRSRKCQNFERMSHTLYILMMKYKVLKGLPSVPC